MAMALARDAGAEQLVGLGRQTEVARGAFLARRTGVGI